MKDISILNPNEEDDSLITPILISLFTDKQATDEDTQDEDKRGFWGDSELGSKLWLLDRSKKSPQVLVQAEQYATEALRWLIEESHISDSFITATYQKNDLIISIEALEIEVNYDQQTCFRRTL